MTALRVLVLGDARDKEPQRYAKFAKTFELVPYTLTTRDALINDFKTKFSDIVAIFPSWMGFVLVGGMKGDLLDALPQSVKIIGIPSVGYDHYDVVGLKKRGIILNNSPGMSAPAVADLALHLTLSTIRYTTMFEQALRQTGNTLTARIAARDYDIETGALPSNPGKEGFAFGHRVRDTLVWSPQGKRAGIAGYGQIGKQTAARLSCIGMEIHTLNRSIGASGSVPTPSGLGFDITPHKNFEDLARNSDVLILCLPATPETKHILNEKTIALMPKGAKIINVGRGALIDQKALVKGLETGQISSAGLDVFEHEPIVEPELLNRYDVTLLPHLGGCYAEAVDMAMINIMDSIEDVVLHNGTGNFPVNL